MVESMKARLSTKRLARELEAAQQELDALEADAG